MLRMVLGLSRLPFSKISDSMALLQLSPPTTRREIRTKYIELAKQHHPDITLKDGRTKSPEQVENDGQTFIQIA